MITTDVMPCFAMKSAQLRGVGGTTAVMLYTRGSEVVEEEGGAWAIRGTLEVGGHSFATIERAGGFVALKPGTYAVTMERSANHGILVGKDGKALKQDGNYLGKADLAKKPGATFMGRKQMRPQHSQTNIEGKHAAILLHPGAKPSHFLGCIGIGETAPKGLQKSSESVEQVFKLLGGFKEGKVVQLKVVGENPGKTKPGK